jgi:cytochrome c biogenesis protein CcmG/thiol:disulfide interchange protein DsbE
MRGGVALGTALMSLLLILGGCAETSGLTRIAPSGETGDGPPVRVDASTAALAGQKRAAGIADCPVSDQGLPAVAGGLPDVVLSCLGGGRNVRLAGLRGRPMMVSVWAQWCGPCRTEAPFIAQVAATNKSDLMVLGVDFVDPLPGKAIQFAGAAGWKYPQLADTDKVIAAPLQIIGPPQTLFVRADGTIAYRQSGAFTSASQIRRLAQQHLGVNL